MATGSIVGFGINVSGEGRVHGWMTQNLKGSARAARRTHPYQASSPQNEGEPSVASPLSWRHPVQDGANAHEADAPVKDGVADQMNLAFVGHRAQ